MNVVLLPKETTYRFVLLMVLAFLVIFDTMANGASAWIFADGTAEVERTCHATVAQQDVATCRLPATRAYLIWTVCATVGLMALGLAAAVVGSWWRRRGLRPVPSLPAVEAVERAVVGADEGTPYPLLWQKSRPIGLARADGIWQPYVEVGPTFLALAYSAPDRARAILRHEYAHHRMSDVLPSRITLWLPLTILVFVVVASVWPHPVAGSGVGDFTVALLVLLFVARQSFLRARETAADIDAATGDRDGLEQVLGSNLRHAPRLRRLFASHPTPQRRLQVTREPGASCSLGVCDGMLIGLAASAATGVISQFVVAWFAQPTKGQDAAPVSWAIVGALLGAWLTAMAIRAVAASDSGTAVPLTAFSIGLGYSVAAGSTILILPGSITNGTITALAAATLGLTAIGILWWVHAVTQWTWSTDVSGRPSAATLLIVVGAVVGSFLLSVAGELQAVAWVATAETDRFVFYLAIRNPVPYLFAAALLVVVPVLLSMRPARTGGRLPGWLNEAQVPDGTPDPPSIRLTVAIGFFGGVTAAVAYAVNTAVHPIGSGSDTSWFTTLVTPPVSIIPPAAVLAATVACAAVRTKRAPVAIGLLTIVTSVPTAIVGIALDMIVRGSVDLDRLRVAVIGLAIAGGLGGLVLAALTLVTVPPDNWARWPVVTSATLALPVIAGVLGVMVAAAAQQIRPSRDLDLHQVSYVHHWVTVNHTQAHRECEGEPVTPGGVHTASDAVRRLETSDVVAPATDEIRRAHLARLTMYVRCAQAIETALSDQRDTITPQQQLEFREANANTNWLQHPRP